MIPMQNDSHIPKSTSLFYEDLMATKETQNNQMAGQKSKGRIGKRENQKRKEKKRKIKNQIHAGAQMTISLKY
jgi:hypothetical protein